MDRKVVNNFVVRVLAPPRIPSQQLTLIRYRGLYLMHMQKYHTWVHKFPSPPFNMHILNKFNWQFVHVHVHAPKKS